jgi:hypothetical protein
MPMVKNLLWIDGGGAALVGVAVLTLSQPLSRWYALPSGLLRLMGVVNLAYGAYSLSLASRSRRALWAIRLLVFANFAWAVLCLVVAVAFARSATWLGLGQLVVEAVYVGGLASLEWRWRQELRLAKQRWP